MGNLADISFFESIQSEQHNRTNMSSMSVFNDLDVVKSTLSKMGQASKQVEKITDELDAAEKTVKQLTKELNDKMKVADEISNSVHKIVVDEADRINRIADEGVRKRDARALADVLNKVYLKGSMIGISSGGKVRVY